jgi:nicotinate-nucleotide adenylyltransferase
MAKINFSSTLLDPFPSEVAVDLIEIERKKQRPTHPSYTFETLGELRQRYAHLAFVVGADQLEQLNSWYRFPELLKLCHWIVLERKPSGGDQARRTLQTWCASGLVQSSSSLLWQVAGSSSALILVPTPAQNISSTAVRESISRTGLVPDQALLPEVSGYLKVRKLYGM